MSAFQEENTGDAAGAAEGAEETETLGSILQSGGPSGGPVPVEFALPGGAEAAASPARRKSPIVVLIIGMAGSGKVCTLQLYWVHIRDLSNTVATVNPAAPDKCGDG